MNYEKGTNNPGILGQNRVKKQTLKGKVKKNRKTWKWRDVIIKSIHALIR